MAWCGERPGAERALARAVQVGAGVHLYVNSVSNDLGAIVPQNVNLSDLSELSFLLN